MTVSFTTTIGVVPTPPVAMTVSGGLPRGSASSADGPGLRSASAGVVTSFNLFPFDQFGNKRDQPGGAWSLVFFLETGSGIAKTVTQITPLSFNFAWDTTRKAYVASYSVETAGTLVIYVTLGSYLDGDHVKGSPFRVRVSAAATSAANCRITGIGLNGAVANVESFFIIQARDRFNNDVTSGGEPFRVEGSVEGTFNGDIFLQLFDNNDGTYTTR